MQRPYTYFDYTQSLCSKCLVTIPAKVIFQDGQVFMHKRCPDHGLEKVLIEADAEYYRRMRNYIKQSEMPLKYKMPTKNGCPHDCGLCVDHEQHSCLAIVEITDRCNLTCPTCYAMSSPHFGNHRSLAEVEKMFDILVEHEGRPDVVQISGGEPTLHPQFFEILAMAKSKPIRHLMLNTNGIRIANEKGFAEELKKYSPAFEIYLQFDSFEPEVLKHIRGAYLSKIRIKALENLNAVNLSTNLVVTLQKGWNDGEIGKIINFALKQKCVRGVTFQPTQVAGRNVDFDSQADRITLSEVRQKIIEQSDLFTPEDLLPVPCNPDALTMGYALKLGEQAIPLTRFLDPNHLLDNSVRNTIIYEHDPSLRERILKVFSTGESPEAATDQLNALMGCMPEVTAPKLGYDNIFRVIIMKFMDAHDFDVRAVKKSCVHIVHRDGRIIPFETMNLFYRQEKEIPNSRVVEKSRRGLPISDARLDMGSFV